MDPLQWMGAVRIRYSVYKIRYNYPHDSSPSINILWSKKAVYESTIKAFLL